MENFSSIFEIYLGVNLAWVVSESFQEAVLKQSNTGYFRFVENKNKAVAFRLKITNDNESNLKPLIEIISKTDKQIYDFEKKYFGDPLKTNFNFTCLFNVFFSGAYLILIGLNLEVDISKTPSIQYFVVLSFLYNLLSYKKILDFTQLPFKVLSLFVQIVIISLLGSLLSDRCFMPSYIFNTVLVFTPIIHFILLFLIAKQKSKVFHNYNESIEGLLLDIEKMIENKR